MQGADGLTEDTRFNRPARDGVLYTEEGMYTITARNRYTNQETVKCIYVGTNNILVAHMNTGYSINAINQMIALGASVTDEGEIIQSASSMQVDARPYELNQSQEIELPQGLVQDQENGRSENIPLNEQSSNATTITIAILIAAVAVLIMVAIFFARKNKQLNNKKD